MAVMKDQKRSIEIRELFGDQISELDGILASHKSQILFPHLAMAKVAYDGDRIVGYHIFQMLPHIEPLWVDPEYRGGDLTHELVKSMDEFAKEAVGHFVCIATSEFSARLCREIHMDVMPGQLFIGRA